MDVGLPRNLCASARLVVVLPAVVAFGAGAQYIGRGSRPSACVLEAGTGSVPRSGSSGGKAR